MPKHPVHSDDAPKAIGPYSQAVTTDTLVFLSGQIGIDPKTGNLVEGGVEAETEQVLRNLRGLLQAAGLSFDDVVRTTIYLTDLSDFTRVNEIYGRALHPPFPARATVGVSALPRGAKVEIDAIAIRRTE
jgi:2-iminobutanoate/2-iminopropanoate deaminase